MALVEVKFLGKMTKAARVCKDFLILTTHRVHCIMAFASLLFVFMSPQFWALHLTCMAFSPGGCGRFARASILNDSPVYGGLNLSRAVRVVIFHTHMLLQSNCFLECFAEAPQNRTCLA